MNSINGIEALESQAQKLLDANQKFDVQLLDTYVGYMYQGEGPQVQFKYFSGSV